MKFNGSLLSVKRDILKKMQKAYKAVGCRGWSFIVNGSRMINKKEITKYVSRNNPLAIVKYDDQAEAYVHISIINKARFLPQTDRFNPLKRFMYEKEDMKYITLRIEEIRHLIHWCKLIKNASWGTNKENTKVEVFFPNI